jgi:hypothetical protein
MILAYKFLQWPEVFWPKLQVNLLVWISWTFGQAGYLPYTSSREQCIFSSRHYSRKWHSSTNFASGRKFFHRNFRAIFFYRSAKHLGKRATYPTLPVESTLHFLISSLSGKMTLVYYCHQCSNLLQCPGGFIIFVLLAHLRDRLQWQIDSPKLLGFFNSSLTADINQTKQSFLFRVHCFFSVTLLWRDTGQQLHAQLIPPSKIGYESKPVEMEQYMTATMMRLNNSGQKKSRCCFY